MVQTSENLPLIPEAVGGEFRAQLRTHDLKSNLLSVLAVGTNGAIHCAHSPNTNFLENLVDTDTLPRFQAEFGFIPRMESRRIGTQYIRACLFVRQYQRLNFSPQSKVRACLIQKTWPLSGFYFQSRFQDRPDSTPFLGGHACSSPRVISCNSHALAELQLRFTVAVEIPRTCEVSSSESPPKYRNSTIWLWRASSLARRSRASFSVNMSTSPCRGCCAASPRSGDRNVSPAPRLIARRLRS